MEQGDSDGRLSLAIIDSGGGCGFETSKVARRGKSMLGWVILALLVIEMETTPVVFYPGGTMMGSSLKKGTDLNSKRLGRRLMRLFWQIWHNEIQIREREKQDDEFMIRPLQNRHFGKIERPSFGGR
ncbi:unnamed protein product [Cuscuta europaea]|uniref:Uncharacterized protein n=1 Tax=Cuscuta europaea TaxID=41803 RepID=A0A9P0Z306_CUSEU|nr:unnamed protein product [Cuscuta europaea]